MNSNELEAARGTEVYYSKGNNDETTSGLTSYKMAKILANNLYVAMDTKLRGVLNNDYYDLKMALKYKQVTLDKVKQYLKNQSVESTTES